LSFDASIGEWYHFNLLGSICTTVFACTVAAALQVLQYYVASYIALLFQATSKELSVAFTKGNITQLQGASSLILATASCLSFQKLSDLSTRLWRIKDKCCFSFFS
jgi:hypothetical protein